jgi:Starch-binding associating with outer membrane
MKNRNLIYTGIAGLLLFSSVSCSDYLDINTNPNYPAEVNYPVLLPSGIAATAAVLGSSYELYGGMWAQHYTQGQTSNQYNTIVNFSITNASENRMWNTPYSIALPDLDLVVKQTEAAAAWNYWAIAKVMMAFNYHVLVDTYGSIPFTEALKGDDGVFSPKFDDSKTVVYPGILAMLDEVIAKAADLEGASLRYAHRNRYAQMGSICQKSQVEAVYARFRYQQSGYPGLADRKRFADRRCQDGPLPRPRKQIEPVVRKRPS